MSRTGAQRYRSFTLCVALVKLGLERSVIPPLMSGMDAIVPHSARRELSCALVADDFCDTDQCVF
jgi:hypothetical protein